MHIARQPWLLELGFIKIYILHLLIKIPITLSIILTLFALELDIS